MSDFPIQTSSPEELSGGQRPMTPERRGNEHNQVFPLTGAKSIEVNNDQAASTVSPNNANGAATRPSGDVSGMNTGFGRSTVARPVDARNIEGSYKGDTRTKPGDTAKASLDRAADNGGPRRPSGQFPNGRRDATLGSFSKDGANQNFPGNLADSDAGN